MMRRLARACLPGWVRLVIEIACIEWRRFLRPPGRSPVLDLPPEPEIRFGFREAAAIEWRNFNWLVRQLDNPATWETLRTALDHLVVGSLCAAVLCAVVAAWLTPDIAVVDDLFAPALACPR